MIYISNKKYKSINIITSNHQLNQNIYQNRTDNNVTKMDKMDNKLKEIDNNNNDSFGLISLNSCNNDKNGNKSFKLETNANKHDSKTINLNVKNKYNIASVDNTTNKQNNIPCNKNNKKIDKNDNRIRMQSFNPFSTSVALNCNTFI